MKNNYSFIQYNADMVFPDGIYNGKYNKEPAIFRVKDGIVSYVQFIDSSCIYKASGILKSSVEILLPAQQFNIMIHEDQG